MKYEMLCEYTILTDPKPKARPRFTKQGRTYTPKETKDYETLIKNTLINAHKEFPVEDRPLILEIEFHLVKPKTSKRFYPTVKPDIDNLMKAIMDAANEIIYKDDCLICDVHAKKRYSPEAYIRIKLSYLDCVMDGQEVTI